VRLPSPHAKPPVSSQIPQIWRLAPSCIFLICIPKIQSFNKQHVYGKAQAHIKISKSLSLEVRITPQRHAYGFLF
jgi:hypothetical protein